MKGEEPRLLWRQKEGKGWTERRRRRRAAGGSCSEGKRGSGMPAVSDCVILCDFSREKGGEIRVQVKTVTREEN